MAGVGGRLTARGRGSARRRTRGWQVGHCRLGSCRHSRSANKTLYIGYNVLFGSAPAATTSQCCQKFTTAATRGRKRRIVYVVKTVIQGAGIAGPESRHQAASATTTYRLRQHRRGIQPASPTRRCRRHQRLCFISESAPHAASRRTRAPSRVLSRRRRLPPPPLRPLHSPPGLATTTPPPSLAPTPDRPAAPPSRAATATRGYWARGHGRGGAGARPVGGPQVPARAPGARPGAAGAVQERGSGRPSPAPRACCSSRA